MSAISDICRKMTALTPVQIEQIEKLSGLLAVAADLAHAQATVYARARNERFLVVIGQARPNTCFIQHKPHMPGSTVYVTEEPLVAQTLAAGKVIQGQREWALGSCMEMYTVPVYDSDGQTVAAVSFETNQEEARSEGHELLQEAAWLLLAGLGQGLAERVYRPLSASDGIVIVNAEGQIVFANPAANSIYKVAGIGKLLGRYLYDRPLAGRFAKKNGIRTEPYEAEMELASLVVIQRYLPLVRDGKLVYGLFIVSDVTEVRKKEKELLIKSAVIQEIHHRVKNNLQTIASLLRLQARRSKSTEVKAALRESVNRILSISLVHEFLSQQDAEIIDVAEVAKNILDLVIQNMLEPDFNLQAVFNGETIILPSEQATSLALVINELIQNSIEHGFVGRQEGIIGIDIATMGDVHRIEIFDNGIGLPEDFDINKSSSSLGLQIVRTLIENDVGGSIEFYSRGGTHACIKIPRKPEGDR